MADYYYALNVGQSDNPQAVAVGTSTQSEDIELHVSTTNVKNTKQIIQALRTFEQYLLSKGIATSAGFGVDVVPI